MHHVKHIRKGGEKTTGFQSLMAKLNRKQIPVCITCHQNIHAGKYDGHSLKELQSTYTSTNHSELEKRSARQSESSRKGK